MTPDRPPDITNADGTPYWLTPEALEALIAHMASVFPMRQRGCQPAPLRLRRRADGLMEVLPSGQPPDATCVDLTGSWG